MRIYLTIGTRCATRGALFVLGALTLLGLSPSRADVSTAGNISPTVISDAGGDVGGDLIIGDTGVGGLFMDIAPPLSGTLMSLESTNGIIGNGPNSIGAAVFDDFGVEWIVSSDLSVGNEGQGFIDVFDSASIEVSGKTILGVEDTGQGEITLNGVASRLVTDDLTVGEDGVGVIKVLDRGSLWSGGVSIIGDEDQGDGTVQVSGSGSRWYVGNRLTIDDGAGGTGKLQIDNQGIVFSSGSVEVNPLGRIELGGMREGVFVNGGTLRLVSITAGSEVSNGGLVSGDGFIDGAIDNTANGVISNRAAGPDLREHLRVSGPVTNDGTIDSFRGEMTFESLVTNNLKLIARDAIMNFNGGLTNNGDLVVGGDTTFHTPGTILSSGDLHVLADSAATIVGDLTFSGSSAVSLTAGPTAGTLDVIGTIDLGSATLEIDYSAGVFPQTGDTYEILDSTQAIVGTFANAGDQVTDGNLNIWDIIYNSNSVYVTATGVEAVPPSGDFDSDLDVDGSDFLAWQPGFMTLPSNYDATDLVNWQAQYGTGALASAAVSAVPEPSALLLASLAVGCCSHRRRYS